MKLEWPTIIFFLLVHVLSIVALQQFSWSAFLMLIFLGWVTGCLGLTLGYHRLLSHRSFSVPQWLERVFATCGALSAEYGPIQWVGLHRQHHKFSDQELDPHNINRRFWWGHGGWMLELWHTVKTCLKHLESEIFLQLGKSLLIQQRS